MKTKLALIIILISVQVTEAQWIWQNPVPQGNTLNAIQMLNSSTVYAVGEYGSAIKSTDSGQTWKQLDIHYDNYRAMHFVNNNTGYVLATTGNIYKTVDEGNSWQTLSTKIANNYYSIWFVNETVGFVSGYYGYILKTTDGGISWEKKNSKTINTLNKLYFLNEKTGFAIGKEGTICKTTDGGESWKGSTIYLSAELKSIFFIDGLNGWILAEPGMVYITSDGGNSWNLNCGNCISSTTSFWFFDKNNGRTFGINDNITSDGGKTWTNIAATNNRFTSVSFCDTLNGWAIGNYGRIAKTVDGGNTWVYLFEPQISSFYARVFFLNENLGWICSNPGLMKTTNGGATWDKKFKNESVNNVFFFDDKDGFIIKAGRVMNTSDGGDTWMLNTNIDVKSFIYNQFACGNNIWLYDSDNKRLFYSPDRGKTIEDTLFSPFGGITKIFFLNGKIGWIVNNMGRIAKTIDGGNTWEILPSISRTGWQIFISAIYFLDDNLGWISITGTQILRTYDGGKSWVSNDFPQTYCINSFFFFDENSGWAIGSLGNIFKTTNGGVDWAIQTKITSSELIDIFFVNDKIGWIVGSNSTILKTTNGGITSVDAKVEQTIPSDISLSQNYPNPFNPETTIRYKLQAASNVSLKVYDLLGREVATLVDEYKAAGIYQARFSVKTPYMASLPSSIYFYRLNAGSFVQTKKMLLLK